MAVECGWSYLPVYLQLQACTGQRRLLSHVGNRAWGLWSSMMLLLINIYKQVIHNPPFWVHGGGLSTPLVHFYWHTNTQCCEETYSLLHSHEQMMLLLTEHPAVSPCLDACKTEGCLTYLGFHLKTEWIFDRRHLYVTSTNKLKTTKMTVSQYRLNFSV